MSDLKDPSIERTIRLTNRIEQLEAALRQIARPVFVTEPAGTPESPWQVALRERIELAQEVLGDTQ